MRALFDRALNVVAAIGVGGAWVQAFIHERPYSAILITIMVTALIGKVWP